MDLEELRARVLRERRLRGWSEREAAAQSQKDPNVAGISNTTWGNFEQGKGSAKHRLTDSTRIAISVAFDWPRDWPAHPPAADPRRQEDFERLAALVGELGRRVDALAEQLDAPTQQLDALTQRIDGLTQRIDALEHPTE